MEAPTSTGTCRNLARLLNFSFMVQQLASLGFLIVSVGVDLGLSLHWKSLESRLKMQEIITVRVFISPTVFWCSHSDTEPYKNLPQSDFTETALLQLGPTAGAEGGVTDLEQQYYQQGCRGRQWATALNTHLSVVNMSSSVSHTETHSKAAAEPLTLLYHNITHTPVPQHHTHSSTTTSHTLLYHNITHSCSNNITHTPVAQHHRHHTVWVHMEHWSPRFPELTRCRGCVQISQRCSEWVFKLNDLLRYWYIIGAGMFVYIAVMKTYSWLVHPAMYGLLQGGNLWIILHGSSLTVPSSTHHS